jgi:uncharacterized membrane protein
MRSRYVRKPALRRVVTLLDCMKCRVQRLLRHSWTDLSAWALVLTNMVTISAAFLKHWSFSTIIWVYWCQILIIGVFAFLRTIALTDLSLTGVERIRLRFTLKGKLRTGAFFLAHFTVVQLCLTFVLWLVIGPVTNVNGTILLFTSLLFFTNHLFSAIYNKKRERVVHKNLGFAVLRPYLRMLPLFVAFLFAGIIIASLYLSRNAQLEPVGYLVLFVLKTGADVIAHSLEHSPPTQWKIRNFF